jgi:TIR domain
MSKLFLSHASSNNAEAVAIRDWLREEGWSDVFLDIDPDPEKGISPGERWEGALNQAASRCQAVLCLVSQAWLDSRWCLNEFNLARRLNKPLFGALIEDIPVAKLPPDLTGTWQIVDLASGSDHRMFRVVLPRTHQQQHVTFSSEGLGRLRGGLAKSGIEPKFFAWPPPHDPHRAPYRGLKPLEAEDAGIFFGREGPIVEALDALRGLRDAAGSRLFVILGASGAGKSSFLRAGLLPRLSRDDLHFLPLPVIRPEAHAVTGEEYGLLHAIEAAFADHGAARSRAAIRKAIDGGAAALRPLFRQLVDHASNTMLLAADTKKPTVVLAIDQAEELLEGDGAKEGELLLDLIRDLVAEDDPAVIVLFTIRSDSYDKLETSKKLEGLRQQTLPLLPMPSGAYKEVIEGPAKRLERTDRAIAIEPRLVQRLLVDLQTGGASDALPLLSFTMEQLYLEYGGDGDLTLADYISFGGIKGAIAVAVDRALASADRNPAITKDPAERLKLLRRGMIPLLAGVDAETGNPRRRIAKLSAVPAEAVPLILLLRDNKLLSTDRIVVRDGGDERKETTIEPAHEALLRQWDNLRGWLEADRALLTTIETVKHAAAEWMENHRSADWLNHSGTRLEYAESAIRREDLTADLPAQARDYIRECRARDETEQREKQERLERERAAQERRAKDAEALAAAETKRAADAETLAAVETRRAVANRRALIGAGVGLVVVMVLAVAAGALWQKARNNLAAARAAISALITTAETMQPIAQLDTVEALIEPVHKTMDEFSVTGDPTIELERAETLLILAEINWDRADLRRMEQEAETALGYLTPLAKTGDLEARHQLARSHRLIGLAHWEADRNGAALHEYDQAVEVLADMLAKNGDRPDAWRWQRSLADVREELGDVLLQHLGDIDAAAMNYDACYKIRLDLVQKGHVDPIFHADVAWTINKLGDVEQKRSDKEIGELKKQHRDRAVELFDQAQKAYTGLQEHLSDSLVWQHRLALIENNIGLIDIKNGDLGGALAEFNRAAQLLKPVVDRDPKNLYRLSALAWTYDNQGNVMIKLADSSDSDHMTQLENAKQRFEWALDLRRKIHADARAKKLWEYDLDESEADVAATQARIDRLSDKHREAAAQFDQAAQFIKLAAEVFARESTNKPSVNAELIMRNIEYLAYAAEEYAAVGEADNARNDFTQAMRMFETYQAVLDAADADRLRQLLAAHNRGASANP